MPARVLALSGAGLALSLVGLARDTGTASAIAYGNALMVCAAFYLLVAWVWHLRLDGVSFLNPGKKHPADDPNDDSDTSEPARKRKSGLAKSVALAGLALLAVALAFQYILSRFM